MKHRFWRLCVGRYDAAKGFRDFPELPGALLLLPLPYPPLFRFQSLFSNGAAMFPSPRITLVSVLVAYFAAGLSSPRPMASTVSGKPWTANLPVLSAFLEARVEISAYDPLVEFRPTKVLHVVLHEAKPAG